MMAVVICMVAAIAIRSLITNIYLSKIMGVSNEINVIWECVLLGGKKIAYIVAALMSLIYVVLPMPELLWGINRVFKYISMLWEASMQNKNKPLLLRPSGKDYLWGGSRLNDEFEKNIDMDPLAETWECSTHPDGPSYVVSGEFGGQELAEVLRAHPEYLGERHKGENTLPILIKFIDAKKDLSVQVHPTDEYAQENENGQLGKTEMWYVLDAGRDAKLVYGLKQNCTKAEMRRAIADGTVMKYLQKVPIHKDDLFFIQAGTVHAIGAGALVAEIQENSNLKKSKQRSAKVQKNI